jgi:hypothetical protein
VRVLVDEDLASRELIRRLHDALPGDVLRPEPGSTDAEVWDRAQSARVALLTGNVTDFLSLARESSGHHGLLLVYRQNDPSKDMRAADIAIAVGAIDAMYPNGIHDMILAVNSFAV